MKVVALILLITLASCFNVRANHQYWYTANRKTAESGIPYTDVAWNYCDYKCTSFEKLVPGVDFFVISFSESAVKPNFAACYGKAPTGQVKLWNTYISSNSWYEENCGADTEDYYANTQNYQQVGQEGVGIGANFNY